MEARRGRERARERERERERERKTNNQAYSHIEKIENIKLFSSFAIHLYIKAEDILKLVV